MSKVWETDRLGPKRTRAIFSRYAYPDSPVQRRATTQFPRSVYVFDTLPRL